MLFKNRKLPIWLAVIGTGLVVMFADTDAGSIILSAQSGAQWGYRLLLLNLILIPILFIAQELTVRLGLITRKGHGELIKEHFGKLCAWLSVSTLVISCIGAILTEFSGLAGVGALFGVPTWIMMSLVVSFLLITVVTGSYLKVERIALLFGAFELIFLWVAWDARPSGTEILHHWLSIPWTNRSFLYLAAGNIGAVIMPWMIFYQQSAVVDRGLTENELSIARCDTGLGSVITQVIMIAVLITTAATIGKKNPGASLNTVHQISEALIPSLGVTAGKLFFAIGMTGAAMVATIVVSLTAAWGLGEVTGYNRSLSHKVTDAPWFYGIYFLVIVVGALLIASDRINLIKLTIDVEVLNAVLLPIVLGFLYLLACKALPEKYKLKGFYKYFVGFILGGSAIVGLFSALVGIF